MNLSPCPRCTAATFDLSLTRSGLCQPCEAITLRDKADRYLEWRLINQHQHGKWIALLNDDAKVLDHTADRRPIRPGAVLWDYDLRPCTVLSVSALENDHRSPMGAVIWWRTSTGLFDGSRLAYRHPSNGRTAAEALEVQA